MTKYRLIISDSEHCSIERSSRSLQKKKVKHHHHHGSCLRLGRHLQMARSAWIKILFFKFLILDYKLSGHEFRLNFIHALLAIRSSPVMSRDSLFQDQI